MKEAPWVWPATFVLGAMAIAVYFFCLTGGGLETGFSHDDLMNVYRAWQEPLPRLLKENVCFFLYPTSYRPLGLLFYHVFFNAFGVEALPYRLCILVFLLANIWLVYVFVRRLSGSRETAALTALLHSYHVGFVPLYRNTGTCYDIFCGFFYLAAFVLYLRIRQQGRPPRAAEQIGLLGLLICALDAKEMAVTLPVLIGVYELLYHPPENWRPGGLLAWLRGAGRMACWGLAMDLAFIIGKIYGPGGVGRTAGPYHVSMSLATFMHGLRHDLEEVFIAWGTDWFRERNVAILLALLVLLAWRSRLVHFRFAVIFWLAGILPVAFLPARSIYAIYIPLVGFDLCGATLLIELREWARRGICRFRKRKPAVPRFERPRMRQVVTFAGLLIGLAGIYLHKGAKQESPQDRESHEITAAFHGLRTQLPTAKKGVHMLFLKDPFPQAPTAEWAVIFVARLFYRDDTLIADCLWKMPEKPDAQRMKQYDYVFTVRGDQLALVAPE